jgi:transcriptional regulator with XRE-family HTH domain
MVSRWLQGRRPDPASLERVASALGVDLDALLTLAGHRPQSPRDDDPRVAALVAKVRQVTWTAERFLIVDALLDDLRQRSSRVPIEQVALPGMEERVPLRSEGAGFASGGVAFGSGGEEGKG